MAFALLLLLSTSAFASLKGAAWRVRDVAANSDWNNAKNLKLDAHIDEAHATCTVTDTSGRDRAITLALCLPLDAIGGSWWDDPQRSRTIDRGLVQNLSDKAGGVDDSASLYPLAVIAASGANTATCLACPPDRPRMVRFVYDADAKELRAEFDFGLSSAAERFPSRADASVIAFEVPAKNAFRHALQNYYDLYPDAFRRRVNRAGIWMPFGEIGPIHDARDFGFAFHEIAEQQAIPRILDDDAAIGCGSCPYVEPPTYWQQYTGPGKGTYQQRRKQLEDEAANGSAVARATIVSGVVRDTGLRDLYLGDVPYTTQLPWGSNADPDITDPDKSRHWPGKGAFEFDRLAVILNNPKIAGVYVDSMEGWGELLDYDRDHWRVTKYPLTFDPTTKKVALLNFWGTLAWVKKMSDALRHDTPKKGESPPFLMGNDAFYRRWQLAPYVDVPGREYTWVDEKGNLTPVEDERYLFLRAMSGRKPYLMLMNNRYDDASVMEPYFQRSVFYAVYPSMFQGHAQMNETPYFANPAWYNRDRPLFKKYIPMVRRLDEAGWWPITCASADPADIRIERYGAIETNDLAFTIHNPSQQARDVTLALPRDELHLHRTISATEWFGGTIIAVLSRDDSPVIRLHLAAGGYNVIGISTSPPAQK